MGICNSTMVNQITKNFNDQGMYRKHTKGIKQQYITDLFEAIWCDVKWIPELI